MIKSPTLLRFLLLILFTPFLFATLDSQPTLPCTHLVIHAAPAIPEWLPFPRLSTEAKWIRDIAVGSSGKISLVEWKGKLWAIKDALPNHDDQLALERDFHFQNLAYPGEIKLLFSNSRHLIRMPYVPLSLHSFLYNGHEGFDPFSSDPAHRDKKFIGQLGQALMKELKRIHDLGIVHGDVISHLRVAASGP